MLGRYIIISTNHMDEQTIVCPNCGTGIPLTEALSRQIKESLQKEVSEETKRKEDEFMKREEALERDRTSLAEKARLQEQDFEKRIQAERSSLLAEAKKTAEAEATEKLSTELKDMEARNEESNKKLEVYRESELELRKKMREVEEEKKNQEVTMQRRLDEEKEKVARQAKEEADTEHQRKMSEKDTQLDQMKKTIEELRRKSEQGSMQVQGDAQEQELRNMLRASFPSDTIEDVPTGIKGADLVQTVHSKFGQKMGVILWESKSTKAWSDGWVKKLKEDQGAAQADVCILVTRILPETIKDFGLKDGVWVCDNRYAEPLAAILRLHLQEISGVRQSGIGKNEKMEMLYAYLSGTQFRNRIENIVTAFADMKSELDTEKRVMQKIWGKRDKQIEKVMENTAGMYGDLQGIIGSTALPEVRALELPDGE